MKEYVFWYRSYLWNTHAIITHILYINKGKVKEKNNPNSKSSSKWNLVGWRLKHPKRGIQESGWGWMAPTWRPPICPPLSSRTAGVGSIKLRKWWVCRPKNKAKPCQIFLETFWRNRSSHSQPTKAAASATAAPLLPASRDAPLDACEKRSLCCFSFYPKTCLGDDPWLPRNEWLVASAQPFVLWNPSGHHFIKYLVGKIAWRLDQLNWYCNLHHTRTRSTPKSFQIME